MNMNAENTYWGDISCLQHKLQKASLGKPLQIAFLGASITFGYSVNKVDQFFSIIENYLKKTYHSPNIICHNLSVPGLASPHGLFQCYFELTRLQPDIIVLDYSINDQKSRSFQESYEGLLLACSHLSNKPAVLSFFVKSQSGYTCSAQMSALHRHYHIPYIDIGSQLMLDISLGNIHWSEYSYDDRHPGTIGHRYIADCLLFFLENVTTRCPQYGEVPEKPLFSSDLANLQFYGEEWENTEINPSPSLKLNFFCRTLYLSYQVGTTQSYGKACLQIDTETTILDSYRVHEWEHPDYKILHLSAQKEQHAICLSMCSGDEKKFFHLNCLGFY